MGEGMTTPDRPTERPSTTPVNYQGAYVPRAHRGHKNGGPLPSLEDERREESDATANAVNLLSRHKIGKRQRTGKCDHERTRTDEDGTLCLYCGQTLQTP